MSYDMFEIDALFRSMTRARDAIIAKCPEFRAASIDFASYKKDEISGFLHFNFPHGGVDKKTKASCFEFHNKDEFRRLLNDFGGCNQKNEILFRDFRGVV